MSLFVMNFGQARTRLVQVGAVVLAGVLIAGCGNNAKSVVTPIGEPGPASQPKSLVGVISSPSPTSNGIVTVIDYAGDTVMAEQPIGVGPLSIAVDGTGVNSYTINSDHTLTNFSISTTLQENSITYTTLPSGAEPENLFAPLAGLWATDQTGNQVDIFSGSPQAFVLDVPVAPTPAFVVGVPSSTQRNFDIGLNSTTAAANSIPLVPYDLTCNNPANYATLAANGQKGEADTIEVTTHTISNTIPLGVCPVYAVPSSDGKRLFVLNRGDDTITVINIPNNTLDQCSGLVNQNGQPIVCHPTLPLSTSAVTATGITPPNGTAGMTATAGPVYAEYNSTTSQLVVADYDGGTISVIDVSLDEYGNDSSTFGTTYTVAVGNNPASVTVLSDGSRAYTANQTDGTVSIVNLSSHSVEKTLTVVGHPRTVASTQNSTYGKVYVASPDSPYLTILRTDLDIVDTTILVEGNIVDLRVSSQTAATGIGSNNNNVSRAPGLGQPCNLPLSEFGPTSQYWDLKHCNAQTVAAAGQP